MSEEAVAVMRRWLDGTARGELAVELWDPQCRIENAEGWVIEVEYFGHEGVRQWWDDLDEAFSDLRLEPGELIAIDDERVVSTHRFRGHFRTTGIELNASWAAVITVRDGLMVEAIGYFTKEQAMTAAGVSE